MASLDAFLAAASRLHRRAALSSGRHKVAAELLKQAEGLVLQHPDRAAEIALAVGRVGQLAEPGLVAPFAQAYGRIAAERLPGPGAKWSRVQAREALAAYVAIEGLGSAAGASALPLAARAAEGADLLEASELAAALARLAAARSANAASAGFVGSESASSAHEAAAADVAVALQRPLSEKALVLKELSTQDLCSAAVGLARSPVVLPAAAAAVAAAAHGRLSELSLAALWDFTRANVELLAALQVPEQQKEVKAVLVEAWPLLAASAQESLGQTASQEVGLCLSGLARLAAVLPQGSPEAATFVTQLVRPNATALLTHACDGPALDKLELAGPLLRLAGGEAWTGLLQYLALRGLPGLPSGEDSTLRMISIIEWVAASDDSAACPPFFDFALEELLQRLADVPSRDMRRVVKLLGQVHLERPDLLAGMASAVAAAAESPPKRSMPELALHLSAFATVYVRLAAVASGNAEAAKDLEVGLGDLATAFEKGSAACREVLSAADADPGSDGKGSDGKVDDASCLALSAFAQVVLRSSDTTPAVRVRLVQAGLTLLDALCQVWKRGQSTALTSQQAHIFVTSLRGFCVGQGSSQPPSSALQVLKGIVKQANSASAADKEAQLCLAVLRELAADPACPASLHAVLPAPSEDVTAQKATSQAPSSAQQRLRAAVSSAGDHAAAPSRNMPSGGDDGAKGFLRRMFGF